MKGIDFSRYLSIWLFEFHQTEESFWRKMNPKRLHALFNAWHEPREKQKESLSQFLSNGGGV